LRAYETYLCNKAPGSNINELYFWELSIVLSLNNYVVPSIPFEISTKKIIIQKLENLTQGSYLTTPSSSVTKKVSLEDYYRAHLLAFVLGATDLSGGNIGITPTGMIRFYDNENTFTENHPIRKTALSFNVPFVSLAFDWPQYRKAIDSELSFKLKSFVSFLKDKKDEIMAYSKIRNIPENVIMDLFDRIDLLNRFNFSEETAFVDLMRFIYPQLFSGLPELNIIVSKILNRTVDHGISLFFVTRMLKPERLSDEDRAALDSWIERYISDT